MTDDELLAGFENGTLPNEALSSRRACTGSVFIFAPLFGFGGVGTLFDWLERFAAAHGKTTLYNETVTWAYLLLIRERMARAEWTQNWPEFRAGNADLFDRKRDILKKYYQTETLQSQLAKRTFLFPDRCEGR